MFHFLASRPVSGAQAIAQLRMRGETVNRDSRLLRCCHRSPLGAVDQPCLQRWNSNLSFLVLWWNSNLRYLVFLVKVRLEIFSFLVRLKLEMFSFLKSGAMLTDSTGRANTCSCCGGSHMIYMNISVDTIVESELFAQYCFSTYKPVYNNKTVFTLQMLLRPLLRPLSSPAWVLSQAEVKI